MDNFSSGFSGGQLSAPKGKRFAADVIDLIIIPVVLGVVLGILLIKVPEAARSVILVLVNIAWLIVRDGVYSPGRSMVGLKLVSLSGGKPSIAQAFIRNILLIVPFVLIIGYIVEIVAVLAKGNRLGDKWAKTQVIA